MFTDGPTYLGFVDDLTPSPDRPVGYGYLLWALAQVTRAVAAVAVTQHLLGLLTAVAVYALLRRRGVSSRVAALACLPVLLDQMQLVLEHSVLSDALFDLLLVLAVAALAWSPVPRRARRRPGRSAAGPGVVVRVVGEPALLAAALFCLVCAGSWRVRVARVALLAVAALVPVAAYAGVHDRANGSFAVTQASGRALYMRTTTFVDCTRVALPDYERTLCPREPLGHRLEPDVLRLARPPTAAGGCSRRRG